MRTINESAALRSIVAICVAILGFVAIVATSAETVQAKARSNTFFPMISGLGFVDIDGDGLQEISQINQNKVFVNYIDSNTTGLWTFFARNNISRIVVGNFSTSAPGGNEICAFLVNGMMECAQWNNGSTVYQTSIAAADEQILVGEFTGDGFDDILVLRPSDGRIRIFSHTTLTSNFTETLVDLGNLTGFPWTSNVKVLVGDFGGQAGRDDLMVWDKASGKLYRYDTVTYLGKTTWWIAYATGAGFINTSTETVRVANLTGGNLEGLAVRNTTTGAYRFLRADCNSGCLTTETSVSAGSLTVMNTSFYNDTVGAFFAKTSNATSNARDGAVFLDAYNARMYRHDAILSGAMHSYSSVADLSWPSKNIGWPTVRRDKWAILLCKFQGSNTTLTPLSRFQDYFIKRGLGGMYDYWLEATQGGIDLGDSEVRNWVTVPYTKNAFPALTRDAQITACVTAHGINRSNYLSVIAIFGDAVNTGGIGNGINVNQLDVFRHNQFAGDLGSFYGLDPAYIDDPIVTDGDLFSPMGQSNFGTTWYTWGQSAVGFNAHELSYLNMIPESKILTLTPGVSFTTQTVKIAPTSKPETPGYFLVRIKFRGDYSNPNHYYYVQFRPGGVQAGNAWDYGIPRSGILVHERYIDSSHGDITIHRSLGYAFPGNFIVGQSYSSPEIVVTATSYNADGTMNVTIQY